MARLSTWLDDSMIFKLLFEIIHCFFTTVMFPLLVSDAHEGLDDARDENVGIRTPFDQVDVTVLAEVTEPFRIPYAAGVSAS
jgi:hypothetical protein